MSVPMTEPVPAAAVRARWTWMQSAVEMAALLSGCWPVDPVACTGKADRGTAGRLPGLGTVGGWSSTPRVATRTLSLTPHSLSSARTFTLRTLRRWGADHCADDVAAVMSELLTNALLHALPPPGVRGADSAFSPIRLGLLHPGPCVLCAVADPSSLLPVPRQPDRLSESGRGLQVVASLSRQWGCCPAPDQRGKVVWAMVLTPSVRP
jgi:hypothetical protein